MFQQMPPQDGDLLFCGVVLPFFFNSIVLSVILTVERSLHFQPEAGHSLTPVNGNGKALVTNRKLGFEYEHRPRRTLAARNALTTRSWGNRSGWLTHLRRNPAPHDPEPCPTSVGISATWGGICIGIQAEMMETK